MVNPRSTSYRPSIAPVSTAAARIAIRCACARSFRETAPEGGSIDTDFSHRSRSIDSPLHSAKEGYGASIW